MRVTLHPIRNLRFKVMDSFESGSALESYSVTRHMSRFFEKVSETFNDISGCEKLVPCDL